MAILNASLLSRPARLGLGLLALSLACDKEPSQAQLQAPPTQASPDQEAAKAAAHPEAPRSLMKVGGTYVTAGSQGNTASVDEIEDVQYHWTITGGTITDGVDTPAITYSVDDAASAGILRLYCHLKSAQGGESTAVTSMLVVPPPVLESFEARPVAVTAGTPGNLFWTAREIKSLTLDPGGIDVTKTGTTQINPRETTTYTLTAENLAGALISRQVTVKVVPPPEIRSFGADGRILIGQPVNLKAEFANGKAEIRQGDTLLASSETSPIVVAITPTDNITVSLTVTNEGGTVVTQTRTFQRTGN